MGTPCNMDTEYNSKYTKCSMEIIDASDRIFQRGIESEEYVRWPARALCGRVCLIIMN